MKNLNVTNLSEVEIQTINGGGFGSFFSNLNAGLLGHLAATAEGLYSFAGAFIEGLIEGSEDVIEANN